VCRQAGPHVGNALIDLAAHRPHPPAHDGADAGVVGQAVLVGVKQDALGHLRDRVEAALKRLDGDGD
jgi:hypothetical protein